MSLRLCRLNTSLGARQLGLVSRGTFFSILRNAVPLYMTCFFFLGAHNLQTD